MASQKPGASPDGTTGAGAPAPAAKPAAPGPSLRGRLEGALPGSAEGADAVALLRLAGNAAGNVAQAGINEDGSFEMEELPRSIRGKSVTVDILVPGQGGPAVVTSSTIDFPASGDGVIVVPPGPLDATANALNPSAVLLDPSQLRDQLKERHDANARFAKERKAAVARDPQQDVDWTGATRYLESLDKRSLTGGRLVAADRVHRLDPKRWLTKPSPGLAGAKPPRTARLKLSPAQQQLLQGTTPTLCNVVGARGSFRGLERRPRLVERLRRDARVAALSLPAAPPPPNVPNPPAAPPIPTVAALEKAAHQAALQRAAAAIADMPAIAGEQPATASDLRRLRALAAELEMAGGPANVAAAREVHTLQVAFEQPVTRIFDKRLVADIGKLEVLRARLATERSITLPAPPQKPSRDALARHLVQLRQVLDENAREPAPLLVRKKHPSLTAQMWADLSDEARDLLVQSSAADPPATVQLRSGVAMARSTERRDRRGRDRGGARDHRGEDRDDGGSGVHDHRGGRVRDHRTHTNDDSESEIDALLESSPSVIGEANRTLEDLLDRLGDRYEFTTFVPGSVNYGLLLTYRQEWSPVSYQVGRLVDTLPLSPGERREFKVTRTRRTRTASKTVTTSARESERERSGTTRFESEAIDAATSAINNQISSTGNFNIGVGTIGGSTQFTQDLRNESRRTLKNFSEMATKAVDRLKEQVETTVEESTELSDESADTRVIMNPNNEIMITHLLYELERRYRVETRLQRVRPIVLVALPIPSPDEITIAWILEYSWAIRDALLDPTLADVLDDLEEMQSGAAIEYEVRRAAMIDQRGIAEQLVTEYEALEAAAQARRDAIVGLIQGEGLAEAGEVGTGQRIAAAIVTGGVSELFGGGQTDEDEKLEAQREATEKALEYLKAQIETKGAAMTAASAALRTAVERFTEAAVERRRATLAAARLQVHLRDNLFHYMHAIWAATHPDHRFFELYDQEVPFHAPAAAGYQIAPAAVPDVLGALPGVDDAGQDLDLTIAAPPVGTVPPKRRLADIADIDRPLGFRGNLVVFELRECSQLTDHMAAEYFDPVTGVSDPGALTGVSSDELVEYIQAAIELGVLTQADLLRLQPLARRLHFEQCEGSDEVVVPTGHLFMDALKGDTTLLEPFKLVHRGLDVLAAEEGVRAQRIDALRRVRKVAASNLERDPTSVEHLYLGEVPDVVPVSRDGSPANPPPPAPHQ